MLSPASASQHSAQPGAQIGRTSHTPATESQPVPLPSPASEGRRVQVNSQCLDSFQELKLGKKTKYIVFKLSADNTQIEVEKTSPSASYDDFLNDLPPNSPRYAVYDFEYEKDGGKRNKICFYAWSPDEAKIKEKMLYASSKDALRRSLVGVANEIQGTDSSEVAYDEVLDKISRGTS
ncbi:cofilin [Rhodotorula mucilaginosa]|uniref:Cofilin n=1 Tax=Rhodotorula mucilaginosa TaxID=5537 RepID=A0A9P6W9L4_RHOMI|nr:cofilin [Rhodotorula mucilaginosa]